MDIHRYRGSTAGGNMNKQKKRLKSSATYTQYWTVKLFRSGATLTLNQSFHPNSLSCAAWNIKISS